ncbi:DMT family transporter [Fodinicola acaciae]|uniref:DMT family transporter n=1 Tax=Fodinicola acaciae TaxID=2681555 RepID=UPI001FE7D5F4|nr:DMT family transporter [Fodinicola acaciae]
MTINSKAAPLIAAGVTVLLWASAFVGIRGVGATYSPGALALGRLLIATAILGVMVARRGFVRPSRRALLLTVTSGLLWFCAYNVALNAAERHLDAGTAAMLVNVGPVVLAVLAGIFLKEGFPAKLVVGSAIALAGALVIGASAAGGRHGDLIGVGLCLFAAVTYAGGVIAQKPAVGELPALQVTWMCCAVAAIACLPAAPALWTETVQASGGAIAGLVYLGVFPTAIAFTTWAYALARTEAGKLGATTYLVPMVTALLSWLLLGEVPAPLALAGGALCLVGVAVTRLKSKPKKLAEVGLSD